MNNIEDLLQRGYRYAFSLTHNQQDSEDLVQDACTQILRISGPWNIGYFLKTIRNKFIDNQRRAKKVPFESLDSSIEKNGRLEKENQIDQEIDIESYLSSLRNEEREAIYLSVVEGYTHKEIAKLTEKPIGTILSLVHRAKEKLKNLTKEGGEAS